MKRSCFLTVFLALPAVNAAEAQTAYPMIMSLKPVAAQAGRTTEHTIQSRYSMHGAYAVLITGEGVTGEIIHPKPNEKNKGKQPNLQALQVRFTVAPDAALGVRDFRIATPQGASTLGQLVVGREPVVVETPKNDTAEQAQSIDVPACVCGAIEKAEDVDYFKFHADAGKTLSFHVRSMRLQNKIHDLQQHSDPIITLRNASGTTVAAADNYFFGDPLLSHNFTAAGEYFLEVRDVRYQGNRYWEYCIEISDRAFVTNVHPLGVGRNREVALQMVGFGVPGEPTARLTLPADVPIGSHRLPLPVGNGSTNPAPVVVTDLPTLVESGEDNNTPEHGQIIDVPSGVSGRIESDGDADCYAFEAKKSEKFSFEVIARRQQSALDSHLRILNEKGGQLQLNDDLRIGKRSSTDSWIENWTAPADGKYCIEIRDLHLRGGAEYVYFIKATRSRPYFELYVDTDKTLLTPGTNGVLFVRVVRKNGFEGPVQLSVDGLPDGVTAQCGCILAGKGQDGCIILHADQKAALAAANITIRGEAIDRKPQDGSPRLTAVATAYQETYQPGGGRGHWPVHMHTVSVGAPSDIRAVSVNAGDVTLKPGESKRVDVAIERAEGFDKNVTLDVIYKHLSGVHGNSLPEGVTLDAKNSKTLLTGKTVQGHITLKAADNAPPVERQLVPVMANVSLNFVMKTTYASEPLRVTVAK